MGRSKNAKYHKSLKQQVFDRMQAMLQAGMGTSKRQAKMDGAMKDKIFSMQSYESYKRHCEYFCDYVQEKHPECTTLRQAKKYVIEWLQYRTEHGGLGGKPLSAPTIVLERQALNKLYGIEPGDKEFFADAPKRRRVDITRSRGPKERDKHFSEANNWELVQFCKGTGARRTALGKLKGCDLYTREDIDRRIAELEAKGEARTAEEDVDLADLRTAVEYNPDFKYYVHFRQDKGGKNRYAPVIGPYAEQIAERMRETPPDRRVWQSIPSGADIHGYRGEYATALYEMYARSIEAIPYDKFSKGGRWGGYRYQSQVWCCRKDEKGKKLDKVAMERASKALGHSRLEVIANNYIHNI